MITDSYLLERLDKIREAQIEQGARLNAICRKIEMLGVAVSKIEIGDKEKVLKTSLDRFLTGESLRWAASGLLAGYLLKTGDISATLGLIGKFLGAV